MSKFISDYFNLQSQLFEAGVFDAIIDEDSNFFINIVRLRTTTVPEFRGSYQRINTFFGQIATLLQAADTKEDKFFRAAYKKFDFAEVNGINLGFSETQYGSGFGPTLRKQVVSDAFDIIKKGSRQPEIFHLISLFEENVGPDRLSDMIATIILPDIQAYTRRINAELGLTPDNYPQHPFINGIALNPYKSCELLLLPTDILQELPIARCWDDIDRVIKENEAIRREINENVADEWYRWASRDKKTYLKEQIFGDPEKCSRVIDGYRTSTMAPVDLSNDLDYCVATIFKGIRDQLSFAVPIPQNKSSLQATTDVLNIFRNWVENNKGWEIILDADSAKREKVVQRLVHLAAQHYIDENDLDISFEPNAGRGPADFKISRGSDKTVCEVKLSSNTQYLHGYQVQIEEYALSENATNRCYTFVDVGNPRRRKSLENLHQHQVNAGEDVPVLFIIDSTRKNSASTF